MIRSLVIGGAGFIGTNLVEALANGDREVIVCDTRLPASIPAKVVTEDIRHPKQLAQLVAATDHIYCLAGLLGTEELYGSPVEAVETNVSGLLNVLEILRTTKRQRLFFPTTPFTWRNIYSVSKRSAEEFARAYQQAFGLDIRIGRIWSAFGPGQAVRPIRKVVPEFVTNALLGRPLVIFGDPSRELNLVFVKDLCLATVQLMESSGVQPGSFDFNLGLNSRISLQTLAKTIVEMAKSDSVITHGPLRFGEFDSGQLESLPEVGGLISLPPKTPLCEALRRTVDFYSEITPR